MGQSRFARLMELLPENLTIVGLDEKTALIMDFQEGLCHVNGLGGVTLIHTGHIHPRRARAPEMEGSGLGEIAEQRDGHVHYYAHGETFTLSEVGHYRSYHPEATLPAEIWQRALDAQRQMEQQNPAEPPPEVLVLAEQRRAARAAKNWAASDALRAQIAGLGWLVKDTRDDFVLEPLKGA
jgi:hypothetical protein